MTNLFFQYDHLLFSVSILVLVDLILWLGECTDKKTIRYKFQSLFWWILYCDTIHHVSINCLSLFQSLFWWILYCDVHCLHQIHLLYWVSILVLVDLILWHQGTGGSIPTWLVSILVLVDLILWRFLRITWIFFSFKVSILVLVDLILWPGCLYVFGG